MRGDEFPDKSVEIADGTWKAFAAGGILGSNELNEYTSVDQ